MASAPPNVAAAQAAVVRSMLVHGSRLAIMRAELTAVMCIEAGEAPLASAMRAMMRARGAHLGGIEEQVGVDRQREGDGGQRVLRRDARRFEGAQVGDEGGGQIGELLRFAGAGLVRHGRVDQNAR